MGHWWECLGYGTPKSHERLKLRAGINTGPVIAGVQVSLSPKILYIHILFAILIVSLSVSDRFVDPDIGIWSELCTSSGQVFQKGRINLKKNIYEVVI